MAILLKGYAAACHLVPTLSVTVMVSLLAWRTGWSGWHLLLLVVAVLSGQLSVGWSNDAIDAPIDIAAGRTAKPIVAGVLSVRGLWVAAVAALITTVVASFVAAGLLGGAIQVIAVASAWLYNLRLSRTTWSWLPYAVSFACVTPFITFGLAPPMTPALWAIAVFVSTGVAAHLANALPDLATDQERGLGGLVTRLGEVRAKRLALLLLALSAFILLVQLAQFNAVAAYLIPLATGVVLVLAIRPTKRPIFFLAVQALAAFEVLVLLVTGIPITS